ncbi:MAG: 23S rRNA (adenine(2503)-C(2))-methyltransferase RlmN [Dehalococcoidia bacterium]|nr:23S rRNA (adenine(2503)-C(2))-methyltransferase RlmN [Dehalococcoidia bacterium]
MTINLLDLATTELASFLQTLDDPPSATSRVLKAVYRDCVNSLDDAMELSAALRSKLAQEAVIDLPQQMDERISSDEQTHKTLFKLADGHTIEATLMLSHTSAGRKHCTVCVSSQVGCAIGCPFCATGMQGFVRNLSTSEIMGAGVVFARRLHSAQEAGKMTNVVFMGMGEPLSNYDNVCRAVSILSASQGLGLSAHKIMLSSAGMVPQIRRMSRDNLPLELAVSLHAANDELCNCLVPLNRKYPIAELLQACREYAHATGRLVYFEYAMFSNINDSTADADALLKLLQGFPCDVNLILGNTTDSLDYKPSSREQALVFQKCLIVGGVRAMLRVSRGADIDAGCGQLRSRYLEN